MRPKPRFIVLAATLIAAASHGAAPAPCSSPEHRQFDFWIGDWVIHERYATGKGYSGESLNAYDAARKLWHQTWVDDSGQLLTLEGRWDGKSMILEGGKQRITWTPNADGTVRQLWESANAKGEWTVAFDGRYAKK